ncbi:SRPBCC family protein [Ferrimonas marina]|uniref:Polyketide cyclase / dehydrase and lipid transport n=1 Tax=Ferrimonas marina TaxID=299255 RepID=A0A1M5ZFU6_9GAMM|nr:SRPBCC family protein [Ferrimonas marina]SHI23034.1 Polyketide cyclase / dehydrase and lipid transport [Ferrimonas marina]
MKYQCDVVIDLPREQVVALFDNPDNLPRWQPDLLSFEPLQGVPGQPGSTCRLLYRMGKREVEMVETVLVRDLPEQFSARYQAKGVDNRCDNRFDSEGARTRWRMESEFQFRGWLKLMGWLMPGVFRKQTLQMMNQFKNFAESSSKQP